MSYCCYILKSTNQKFPNLTYTGITTDLNRRLRQHNGEITGGAKATRSKGPYVVYHHIDKLTKSDALVMEYKIKHSIKHGNDRLQYFINQS